MMDSKKRQRGAQKSASQLEAIATRAKNRANRRIDAHNALRLYAWPERRRLQRLFYEATRLHLRLIGAAQRARLKEQS